MKKSIHSAMFQPEQTIECANLTEDTGSLDLQYESNYEDLSGNNKENNNNFLVQKNKKK